MEERCVTEVDRDFFVLVDFTLLAVLTGGGKTTDSVRSVTKDSKTLFEMQFASAYLCSVVLEVDQSYLMAVIYLICAQFLI